ncbi:MAG: tetratricopeptide repeat protein [Cyclobacteriaceae bacterium]|nr:tetratricopeptide repeat protein [Cyclobacteriaceae bacterium]
MTISKRSCKIVHDVKIKAAYYMQSGIIFYFEAVFDKAVNHFWEALTLYEEIGDSVTVASCNLLIGESNRKLGNLDQSLAYFEKALDIYRKLGRRKGNGHGYGEYRHHL